MKKIFLVAFLIIMLVLAGFAAFFSYSFNAENYRGRIIKNLSQMTGRQVNITGPVSLNWTPFPTLSISDLTIANQENSKNPLMLSVEKVQAEIEWASLFKEPFVVKKVVLEKPILLLERLHRYETNFDFPILFKTSETMDPSFLEGKNDFSLSIDEVDIRNGTFTYENVISGDKFVFDGINGKGVVHSLEGPFSFSGSILIAEKEKKVDLRIGKIELSQNLPVSLNLTDVNSETTIETSGFVFQNTEKPDEWLTLSGVIGSKNASLFFKNMGIDQCPSGPLVGSFTLKLMTNKTSFESMTVRQGEGENETSFFLGEQFDEESQKKLPTLVVKNIDYNQWKPLLLGMLGTHYFDELNTDFNIQVEKAKINKELLKQGTARGHLENGVFTFSALTAQLPYDSSLGMMGTWIPKNKEFDVDLQLQTTDLRSLIEWSFTKKVDFLSEEGVKNAQFMGHLKFNPILLEVDTKVGVIDETEFSGQVNVLLKETPDVSANLEIKNFNSNKYINVTTQNLIKELFSKINFDFNFKTENLTLNHFFFQQAKIVGFLKENKLSLKEFSGKTKDNSNIKISVDLLGMGTPDTQIKDLNASFEIPDLSNFGLLNDNLFKEYPIEVKGTIDYTGKLESGNFQTEITFNQSLLKASGIVENPLDRVRFSDVSVSLTHPDVQNFLSTFKKINPFFPYLSGNLQLSFNGNGMLKSFSAKNLLISIDKQSVDGEVSFDLNQKTIKGSLSSSELDLNKFLPSFDEIKNIFLDYEIPSDWQMDLDVLTDKLIYGKEKFTSFKTQMNLKDQVLNIPSLEMQFPDHAGILSFAGSIVLRKPMIIDGKFNLNNLPVESFLNGENFSLEKGRFDASGKFVASGNSWAGLTQSLRSDGNVSWKNGSIRGINMQELFFVVDKSLKQYQSKNTTDLMLKHALSNGSTNVITASGKFHVEQGEMKLAEFKAINPVGEILVQEAKWTFLPEKIGATFSVVFNALKNLPSLDILLQDNKLIPQLEVFEKLLESEAKILQKQSQENKEKQEQQKAEEKKNEILMQANKILSDSENQINQIKDTMALRSSSEGQELMTQLSATLEEVRSLAIRPELNGEQLSLLQEKSSLLNLKSQELKNFLNRQDVVRQREAVQKLPPLVKNRITELIQIYNQNSQSAIMAGLVQGAQKEEEKITQKLTLLTQTEELEVAQKLIEEIKESFKKIQKALNYARRLDLAGGSLPAGE